MDDTELFILFPRYEDCNKEQVYLREVGILPDEEIREYIDKVRKIKDFFTYEEYRGYYDAENLKVFLYPSDVDREFYPNIKTLMKIALRGAFENWRECKKQEEGCCFKIKDGEAKNDTTCEIASRKRLDGGSTFLLIDCDALEDHFKNGISLNDANGKCMIEVCDTDIKNIADWLSENRRQQREFHCIPKHGENGKGAFAEHKGDKVSVLLCSRQEAGELLKKATGVNTDRLYVYDKDKDRYMEFKGERNNNTYHGYHLEEEDAEKLPKQILEKVNMLR